MRPNVQRWAYSIVAATTLLLSANPTHAASIGLFSTSDCSSCNLTIATGETDTLFIATVNVNALPGVDGVLGAEFKVLGLPEGWTVVATPQSESNVNLGDPFGSVGAVITFPFGQTAPCVNLYTVAVTANSHETEVRLQITKQTPPTTPLIDCPAIIPYCESLCPFTPPTCVDGGNLFINSSQDCSVAVEARSWSEVRGLFR